MTKKEIKRLTLTDLMKEKEKYQVKDDVTEVVLVEPISFL